MNDLISPESLYGAVTEICAVLRCDSNDVEVEVKRYMGLRVDGWMVVGKTANDFHSVLVPE